MIDSLSPAAGGERELLLSGEKAGEHRPFISDKKGGKPHGALEFPQKEKRTARAD